MSIAKTLFGIGRTIPETDEVNWGDEVTNLLDDLVDGVEGSTVLSVTNGVFPQLRTVSATLTASATLTPAGARVKVQGSGGAVTLDSTTPIQNGEFEGQLLELQGDHATNTVTILSSGNASLNGPVVLGLREIISLVWDNAATLWVERSRSH